MTKQKFNTIVFAVLNALAGWIAGNLWEGRRTDRLCDIAYDLIGDAQLNSRRQTLIEDQLARECEPAELLSTFE